MSKLDFSGLDAIFLIGKRDRGEELSEDEMRIVEKFDEESAARKRFKSAYFQNKPVIA